MNVVKLHISQGDNPREWDNLSIIAAKNFNADERIGDPIDWLTGKLDYSEVYVERLASTKGWSYYSDEMREHLEDIFFSKFVGSKLYKYEHGTIRLSTSSFSCRWDSGQIGYIYTTKEKIRENWSIKRVSNKLIEKTKEILEGELSTFETYVRGEVYGFTVEDAEGEVLDSCGGFYGTEWETNGILDHIDYVAHGIASTQGEMLEILEQTKIDY